MINNLTKTTLILVLLYLPFTASAVPLTVNHIDSGSYTKYGSHNSSNTNYIAGYHDYYRNWFTFDLSGITQNIVSATLRLYSGYVSHSGTYNVYDISTRTNTLIASGSGKTRIYNDLGTGLRFGSKFIRSNDDRRIIDVVLNGAAIASLNASNSVWAIGGRFASSGYGYAFNSHNSRSNTRQLILHVQPVASVPEPGMMALFLVGFAGMFGFNRRRSAS